MKWKHKLTEKPVRFLLEIVRIEPAFFVIFVEKI